MSPKVGQRIQKVVFLAVLETILAKIFVVWQKFSYVLAENFPSFAKKLPIVAKNFRVFRKIFQAFRKIFLSLLRIPKF